LFEIVPAEEWQLADRIGPERKSRLLGTEYSTIVRMIAGQAKLQGCWRTQSERIPGAHRAEIKLILPRQTVDRFHNGAGGYRAQYYLGADEGERANQFTLYQIIARLKELRNTPLMKGVEWGFIESSLRQKDAKLWIHEGAWLTENRPADRNLFVARWCTNSSKVGLDFRFEPRWAQLTPENETKVDLKGDYVGENLNPVGFSSKPCRRQEIHDFGFT
jgi:hypothetical protein